MWPDYDATYSRAIFLLACREHSAKELLIKLEQKGFYLPVIKQCIVQLKSEDYLNHQRFSEVFIRSYINKGYGEIKIRYGLSEKGIEAKIIDEKLINADIDWLTHIQQVHQKRFKSLPKNYKEKSKQARYLYQRGFDSYLIQKLWHLT